MNDWIKKRKEKLETKFKRLNSGKLMREVSGQEFSCGKALNVKRVVCVQSYQLSVVKF
jgi:hypothetical protein